MPFTPYKASLELAEVTAHTDSYDTAAARDLLARRIVQAAVEDGERDPERLKAHALEGFKP